MKPPKVPSRPATSRVSYLQYFLLALCGIGLIAISMGFIFSGYQTNQAAGFLVNTPSSTFARYDPSNATTASLTPFQPLPTDTPTPTPTNTPSPTVTATYTATYLPPTSTLRPTNPPVDGIPSSAYISGVAGYAQNHNLSCESRSAVDWARFYGISIGEDEFQTRLPLSDNPEKGFVGSIDDTFGQIPPNSYGVYAAPVAEVLRDFGLSATSRKGYDFDDLRRQIANGNPVIVWVIGNVWSGYPISYTASDGDTITVAHYEHTAIVVGYDEYGLTFVDNNYVYWRETSAFLNSWSILGNMAIISD